MLWSAHTNSAAHNMMATCTSARFILVESQSNRYSIRMRVRQCVRRRVRSAAGLRLRDVTFHFVEIDVHDSADQAATAVVNSFWNAPRSCGIGICATDARGNSFVKIKTLRGSALLRRVTLGCACAYLLA